MMSINDWWGMIDDGWMIDGGCLLVLIDGDDDD